MVYVGAQHRPCWELPQCDRHSDSPGEQTTILGIKIFQLPFLIINLQFRDNFYLKLLLFLPFLTSFHFKRQLIFSHFFHVGGDFCLCWWSFGLHQYQARREVWNRFTFDMKLKCSYSNVLWKYIFSELRPIIFIHHHETISIIYCTYITTALTPFSTSAQKACSPPLSLCFPVSWRSSRSEPMWGTHPSGEPLPYKSWFQYRSFF